MQCLDWNFKLDLLFCDIQELREWTCQHINYPPGVVIVVNCSFLDISTKFADLKLDEILNI